MSGGSEVAFDGFADWSQAGATRMADGAEAGAALQRQVGVLAHDFNNLLGVIVAANEALAAQLADGSAGQDLARMSLEAAERGAELLRRLIDVTSSDAQAQSLVESGEVVRGVTRLAQASAPAGVTIVADTGLEPLCVAADRAGLDSALLNLCVNAGHALPEGGAVTVTAAPVILDAAAAAVLGLPAGRYVTLSVTDDGVGMSPAVLARACEPWFTTRAGRGGTGLGLAGVQDFAARSGGSFGLVSEQGVGTTATLYLPRI
ncbi:MAG: ATP-binding protein [Pseudomonadota bacterium]